MVMKSPGPVFDDLDKLNKMIDSFIEEEKNDRAREKKKLLPIPPQPAPL